ncbi:ABC transporter permease subunit [Hyperthermus butylicus]|uniref:Uncharacterized protein n=1 Tax=Hyperthermus butylicus (strain DSM 5456 / JCM 9403 / PLM1-5) TaxID=415426 RepID=A2BIS6_HYPBU|nr:ABC transporter permease subunit [Hyperthermus butylicus]ABM79882.1 hypothetical protein Hbut_0001 [Hyperthermus butylicus DSM 5456]
MRLLSREFLVLVRVEVEGFLRRRSFLALLALTVVPLAVAVLLRGFVRNILAGVGLNASIFRAVWLSTLGARTVTDISSYVGAVMAITPVQFSTVASFAWIIAAMYGAYLFASDIESGRISLILVRPVSRVEIIATKLIAYIVAMALMYTLSAGMLYASFSILFTIQDYPWLIPVSGLLISISTLPLALVAALLGLKLRRSSIAALIAIIIYIVGSFVAAIPIIGASRDGMEDVIAAMRTAIMLDYAEPIHGSFKLPGLIFDAIVSGLDAKLVLTLMGSKAYMPSVGEILAAAILAYVTATILLITILTVYFKRYVV